MLLTEIPQELDIVFHNFLNLFDDECKTILKEKAYYAGGCIYSLANNKKVNDYDIFLTDNKDMQKLIDLPFWKCKTEYALSFGKYQIITKYYGKPEDCVGEFDFKHHMFYYKPYFGQVKKVCDGYGYLFSNRLALNENRARDLEGVYLRIEKFKNRGFVVSEDIEKTILKKTTKKKIKEYKSSRKRSNRNFY